MVRKVDWEFVLQVLLQNGYKLAMGFTSIQFEPKTKKVLFYDLGSLNKLVDLISNLYNLNPIRQSLINLLLIPKDDR